MFFLSLQGSLDTDRRRQYSHFIDENWETKKVAWPSSRSWGVSGARAPVPSSPSPILATKAHWHEGRDLLWFPLKKDVGYLVLLWRICLWSIKLGIRLSSENVVDHIGNSELLIKNILFSDLAEEHGSLQLLYNFKKKALSVSASFSFPPYKVFMS